MSRWHLTTTPQRRLYDRCRELGADPTSTYYDATGRPSRTYGYSAEYWAGRGGEENRWGYTTKAHAAWYAGVIDRGTEVERLAFLFFGDETRANELT